MYNYYVEDAVLEIDFLLKLSLVCPLYHRELDELRHLASMIMRHGGSLSHPMLCKKNLRVDYLYLTACRNMGLLPRP